MMEVAKAVEIRNAETPEQTRKAIFDELRNDLADWMMADKDLVWRPAIELTKEGDTFAARVLMPGVDPNDVEVLVAPEILLIKGNMHGGEAGHRKLLRSIKFPQPVNPNEVHAEMKNGMLFVEAPVAETSEADIYMPLAA
jgi:HSP20 family molecular chaperone IbpA